ncbi:uncharacterized protein M6B38_327215 [Iris pallida]|uniref:Uncharacterized protein n=1 Tax=Iris pallida TaxID=29817 RepID=A0AAX6H5L1_IRIPA|nr:uncharacterized protein M6B38_327215 [Iris pallida]
MVLWEITLATAYFLGLKRTYKLALRIQRRLIGPNHPRIRQFVYRRTRSIFDVAVSVHQKVQQRDLEVGRNLGNWILRWLDRMKPAAEIRPHPDKSSSRINSVPKKTTSSHQQTRTPPAAKLTERDSEGKLSFSALSRRPRSFPYVAMMMRPMRPASMSGQYRHLSDYATSSPQALSYNRSSRSEGGVFRKDIALWMMHN